MKKSLVSAPCNRRQFLRDSAALMLAAGLPRLQAETVKPQFKLGLTTWNLAATWKLAALLENCRQAGLEGVEFRTTHAHGVEPSLSAEQRRDVKQRCADAGLTLWGLGTVCEFHSPDPAVVKTQIETCSEFVKLAADLGARGVKVRPNGLPKEVPVEKTLAQIGAALNDCGKMAADHGVEIWLEVHGEGTNDPLKIKTILDACASPAVGVCWNSNFSDVRNGSVQGAFELFGSRIRSCHINDLTSKYPWHELFTLLSQGGYDRFTLCEYPKSIEAPAGLAFLQEYRKRWLDLMP